MIGHNSPRIILTNIYLLFIVMQKIRDSELGNINFPVCVCPYENNGKFMMVEVNTGYRKGSIKPITKPYDNIIDLFLNFDSGKTDLKYLSDVLIYNNISAKWEI